MDFSSAGTAIMLALAAVLWFLYLLPSWMRRREYLATERNAARLQRTIRVMAEAAEVPEVVRVEATAREAAARERLLREERRRERALEKAQLREAVERAREAERRADAASGRDRLRRARRLVAVLLLAAFAAAAVQLWLMAATGAAVGSWVVLGACAAVAGLALAVQRRILARERQIASAAAPAAPVSRRTPSTLIDAEPREVVPTREWTPVPVPKPLYLERNEAPRVSVTPSVTIEALLREAAAEAERALAAAHAEPEVVPFPARPASPEAGTASAPSRFAAMGVVGDVPQALPDLDEVLRRRRSG